MKPTLNYKDLGFHSQIEFIAYFTTYGIDVVMASGTHTSVSKSGYLEECQWCGSRIETYKCEHCGGNN